MQLARWKRPSIHTPPVSHIPQVFRLTERPTTSPNRPGFLYLICIHTVYWTVQPHRQPDGHMVQRYWFYYFDHWRRKTTKHWLTKISRAPPVVCILSPIIQLCCGNNSYNNSSWVTLTKAHNFINNKSYLTNTHIWSRRCNFFPAVKQEHINSAGQNTWITIVHLIQKL